MQLPHLHDEPLLYIFHMLHGKDVCKLEFTCKRFKHLSSTYDHIVWKYKCRVLWEKKVKDLLRMSEDMIIPISSLDTRNKMEMDALFERTHVPLHEKVWAFQEVYDMKDSNKLSTKLKKFNKRRRLDVSDDRLKLDPTWKVLYSLGYLTEKFHGKYRKKKGPKLYLSPMPLYSPFTVPKTALPMPKTRTPNFQTNRFWGVGNADEIYYVIKERAEPQRTRTNSLTSSGETIRNFFSRGRSNSVSSGESHKPPPNADPSHNPSASSSSSKLSSSTNCLPPIQSTTTTTRTNTKTINNTTISTTTTTTTTTTMTTTLKNSNTNTTDPNNNSAPPPPVDRSKSFEHSMLLPLGHLYYEHRPNGSIDTVGGMWTVIQTRKGRMLIQWRKWRLQCCAEPLMPTKLAYEWLSQYTIQPTSYLDLHYDMHGPWHSGKVVSEKLWKMRPWYEDN